MVDVYLIDKNENKTLLPHPLSFVINREVGAADDLTITFQGHDAAKHKMSKIALIVDNRTEFIGVVDEVKLIEDRDGEHCLIYSRSKAALLLDNEAKPTNYKNADPSFIAYNHLKPFGIDYVCDDDGKYADLNIHKGMSHWQVIKSFCSLCYSDEPYISEDGILVFYRDKSKTQKLFFSNTDGLKYTDAYINSKYYKLISSVHTKATSRTDYDLENTNPLAEELGICRTRYVDAVQHSNNYARQIIDQGNHESIEVSVNLPYFLHCPINSNGKIRLNSGKVYDNLRLRKVKQSFSGNGFKTVAYMLGEMEG